MALLPLEKIRKRRDPRPIFVRKTFRGHRLQRMATPASQFRQEFRCTLSLLAVKRFPFAKPAVSPMCAGHCRWN